MKSGVLKSRCPKCNGNLLYYQDYDESYLKCLQCSKVLYLDDPDSYVKVSDTSGEEAGKETQVSSSIR